MKWIRDPYLTLSAPVPCWEPWGKQEDEVELPWWWHPRHSSAEEKVLQK